MKGFVDEILRKESPKPTSPVSKSVRLMKLREHEPTERQLLRSIRATYKSRHK